MGSLAIAAFGTQLQMGDGATPENFTTIAEVGDIAGPALATDIDDSTTHSSTGGYEDFVATIKRTGEITFPINYVPTTATHNPTTGLLAAWAAKTRKNWKLIFPDVGVTTWAFAGVVTGFSPKAPVGARLTADVSIKVYGQPTLA